MPKEIKKENLAEILSSRPVDEGGTPKWMLNDYYLPIIDNLDERLREFGIRIAFLRDEHN